MEKAKKTFFFIAVIFCSWIFVDFSFAATLGAREINKAEAAANAPREDFDITRRRVEYRAGASRDPFNEHKITGGRKEAVSMEPPPLTIQGIVWGGVMPQAIINNKVVKIGDKIQEATVIDINKKGVTVLFGGKKYNLNPASTLDLQKTQKKDNDDKGGGKNEKEF